MKKIVIVSTFIFLSFSLFSQTDAVGINTISPDPSSVLDITSTDRGILIPRMTTVQRTGIIAPASGLLVYDTDRGTFWYYSGTEWLELLGGYHDKILDTDGDTQVQTEESVDEDIIRFDVKGVEHMTLSQNLNGDGLLQFSSVNGNSLIGNAAGINNVGSNNTIVGSMAGENNISGSGNTFIGESAGKNNFNGSENTFLGREAGVSNFTGGNNLFLGYSAGAANISGGANTFMGSFSGGSNTTGIRNTLVGNDAGRFNGEGDNNTIIGYGAGSGAALHNKSGNVFIGYQAGQNETTDNKLYVENSNDSNPLIYGEFDNDWLKINGYLTPSQGVADTDNDTKMQVEEMADEDIIRFDIAANEQMTLSQNANNDAMLVLSPNTSNTFVGFDVGAGNVGTNNVFFGNTAGQANILGSNNTFMGNQSGEKNITGTANVFIGASSGNDNTTGTNNVNLGYQAGNFNESGNNNTLVGHQAGSGIALHNKSGNVFIGYQSGQNETTDNKLYIENSNDPNPLIYGEFDNNWLKINGYLTPTQGLADADNNTKVQVEETANEDIIRFDIAGNEQATLSQNGNNDALLVLSPAGTNTFIGSDVGVNNTGTNNTFTGNTAGMNNTSGEANTFLGTASGNGNTSGMSNAYLGFEAGRHNAMGNNNTLLGYQAGSGVGTHNKSGNVFIGYQSGQNETTDNKLYIENSNDPDPLIYGEFDNNWLKINGYLTPVQGIADTDNDTKMQVEETVDDDIIRFDIAGNEQATLSQNANNDALLILSPLGTNTFVGSNIGINNTGRHNTFIGNTSGMSNTSGINNTFIGYAAGQSNDAGSDNTFIGYNSGGGNTSGISNTFIGISSGNSNTIGMNNVYFGYDAGRFNETGNNNTLLGYQAGSGVALHNKNGNIFIGYQAGQNEITDNKLYIENSNDTNPLIYGEFDNNWLKINGYITPTLGIADSDNNTKIQVEESPNEDVIRFDIDGTEHMVLSSNANNDALLHFTTSNTNIFIGYQAGINNTGLFNTFLGYNAGASNTTGPHNTFVGISTGGSNTTGEFNTYFGNEAGTSNTTGNRNTLIGYQAGDRNQEGSENTLIGYQAGRGSFTHNKSGNVCIGYQAGLLETGDNKLYIDNSGDPDPLIFGDFAANELKFNGVVGVQRNVSTNDLEVNGDASKGTAGDWLANSDARLKKNIQPLASEEVLEKLLQLQGITYEWDDDETGYERPEGLQYGFTAQNIQVVFPNLVSEDSQGFLQTAYGTYDAMYVEAIRALMANLRKSEKKIDDLTRRNEMEKQRNDDLESRLQQLESLVLKLSEK